MYRRRHASRKPVLVGRSFADPTLAPWVEHEGKRLKAYAETMTIG